MPFTTLSVGARRALAVGLVLLCAAAVAWRHTGAGSRGDPPLRVAPLPGGPAPASRSRGAGTRAAARAAGDQLVVDVVGAVHRQGLVRVPRGSRVADVVGLAGGLTRHAARAAVNLAAPVVDGEQVVVPALGAAGASPAAPNGGTPAPAVPISLSAASAEQLDTLPGIGPVTAKKIVAYRQEHGPFTSVEGLDAIPGIGPARISELKGLVVP